jgi:hypothetical protein
MARRRREFDLELLEDEEVADAAADAGWLERLEPAAPEQQATREAVTRTAQRSAGNRAVSNVLARDPNKDLKKEPTKRPPKIPLKEGSEVDAIFDASPFLKDLVGAKLGKHTLENAIVLDDETAFEAAWLEYAQRSLDPATGKTFTEAGARTFMKIKGVQAFQDETRGKIHIRKERTDLGTQLHEGLHLFSHDTWKKNMNYHVNEGATEFFTRKLGKEVQVERDDSFFLREFTSISHLVDAVGEPAVSAAYFEGDIAGLERKVDCRKPDGAGTWKKWTAHLEVEEYKLANALLAP